MRAPDFILISSLITGELWRRLSRRIRSGPLYRWRFSSLNAENLSISPKDLRPADAALAADYYMGHFTFAQESISTGGEPPFSITPPSPDWYAELHSFQWLRHLRAANTDLMQAHAGALISDWIELWGNQLESQAWRPDIVATRLIAWFSHSPLLTKNTSPETYGLFIKSLARQTRYLHHISPSVRDGYPRLHAMIALSYASLCLDGREKGIKQAAQELDNELERQILSDGGHISRNPITLVELLADLLPLKQAYLKQGHSPTATLISAIDRMMAALRFFRHSNGDLGQFNGTGATPVALMATILRYDESKGLPQRSAPQSGYERLAAKDTVVLFETGKAISRRTARRALAGTLSFELSCGSTRFIANCGVPESCFSLYAPYTRATAAHSTATIGNKSSSRFANDSKLHSLLPSPLIRGPEQVTVSRDQTDEIEDGFEKVSASHDGYLKEFGIVHHRELQLHKNGNLLNGRDQFESNGKNQKTSPAPVEIRFHLPPTLSASLLTSGHSILIATQDSNAWTFTCIDAPIRLEESIQFSGPSQPRKSQQIVIGFTANNHTEIRWTLEQRKNISPPRPRKKPNLQQPFPDLLDGLQLPEEE